MKVSMMLAFFAWPILCIGQQTEGIVFSDAKNWEEVLNTARAKEKIIFVDAYATWCIPCKKMDSETYRNKEVGDFANNTFISLKMQFDKTENDSEDVKGWYADVSNIQKIYEVNAYPTFLFISPTGRLIHKSVGFLDSNQFLELLSIASDSKNDYFQLYQDFKKGILNSTRLLKLAFIAKENKQDSIAIEVAKAFKHREIDSSRPEDVLSKETFRFLSAFYVLFTTRDKLSQYLFNNQKDADSLMSEQGYSRRFTDYLIYREVLTPILSQHNALLKKTPNWSTLELYIKNNFNKETAVRLVNGAKIEWFSRTKDWKNVIKFQFEKFDREGITVEGLGGTIINNFVFNTVFRYSRDRASLNKAASYMETILKAEPNTESWLDTYANILHKLGRTEDALLAENKALAIAIKNKDEYRIDSYSETIHKIKKGMPTW